MKKREKREKGKSQIAEMMRSLISYCLVQWLDMYIRLKIDKRALVQSLTDE